MHEDDLKNKEDLHIVRRHTALDIFRFAVVFLMILTYINTYICTKPLTGGTSLNKKIISKSGVQRFSILV